jgi:hypothetical protein|tara:strand:- start:2 stop:313 length:312 start_codon:yes stop_codon:yes gene_type:complete
VSLNCDRTGIRSSHAGARSYDVASTLNNPLEKYRIGGGQGFETAFLLTQNTRKSKIFGVLKTLGFHETWENAVNLPSVVHLGFCCAKSEKLMKIPSGPFNLLK